MASMEVHIYVTLSCPPEEKHYEEMRSTALHLTNDPTSVAVTPSERNEKTLVAQSPPMATSAKIAT